MSAYEFRLPDVGEGLSEGEIVRWHVAVGDRVKAHQVVVDVETDKAIVEIPSPVAGTVTRLGGEPGDVLPIGSVLITLATDEPSRTAAGKGSPAPLHRAPLAPGPAAKPEASRSPPRRALASPAVRKLALELGVELASLRGSGSRGQITREDVEAAARAALPAAAPSLAPPSGEDRVVPLKGLRRQIATTMERAWREIPHIFTVEEIDAGDLVRARQSLNAELEPRGVKLTYMPFFVRACVLALRAHPSFNASIDTERQEIVYRYRYNIGIATATPDGLLVTVLPDADRHSLAALAGEIETLAGLARERRATPEQLRGGTFTISNFGSYGGGIGMPVIRPPEVAIAGFGRIHDAVVPIAGRAEVRSVLPIVVSTDHRLNDGAHLGAFTSTLATYLREPIRLLGAG
jgi:pyruvate/2-oxoglutarate dehydrogenase complex dihydrolipoamide acyltransferase (E2) component